MKVPNFATIEEEFLKRVNTMIWCNVATVDSKGRPRSRILHPLWEGAMGWICTHCHSYKSTQVGNNRYVSLAYITNFMKPVYVDCISNWIDDLTTKQRVWELFKTTPPPLGFDPAQDFIRYDHENFGLLKLAPWRIALISFPAPSHEKGQQIWHNKDVS